MYTGIASRVTNPHTFLDRLVLRGEIKNSKNVGKSSSPASLDAARALRRSSFVRWLKMDNAALIAVKRAEKGVLTRFDNFGIQEGVVGLHLFLSGNDEAREGGGE